MNDSVKTVLTALDTATVYVPAFEYLLQEGIPEMPLPMMQFAYIKRALPPYTQHSPAQRRQYAAAAAAASRARKAQYSTPGWQGYWAQRAMYRSMGADPNTAQVPTDVAPERRPETPEEREQRLLKLDLKGPTPTYHRRGDRSKEAQEERALMWKEWAEAKTLQAAAALEQRRRELADKAELRGLEKELAKLERTVPDDPMTETHRREVRRAQARARYSLSWPERAVEDELTIMRLGREVPRAARHPLAGTPMHYRPHHPSGD